MLLRVCATINRRYEDDALFGGIIWITLLHLMDLLQEQLQINTNKAFSEGIMVEEVSPSHDNSMRMGIIYCLISNIQARKKLLEMQKGYHIVSPDTDELLYAVVFKRIC